MLECFGPEILSDSLWPAMYGMDWAGPCSISDVAYAMLCLAILVMHVNAAGQHGLVRVCHTLLKKAVSKATVVTVVVADCN